MKKLLGVVFLFLILFVNLTSAQPPITEAQAKAELDKLGLEEDEVRKRLLEKGVDLDNVDATDPAELIRVEKLMQEVIAEIEAEKAGAPKATTPVNTNPKPVEEQVIKDPTAEAIEEIKVTDIDEDVAEALITDFQETLPSSPIFGQQIFRDKSIKVYRKSEDIKPPDSYILGAGDIVAVSIWGVSQEGAVYEINKSGYISPSKMPRIYLKGISYGKAKELLRKRYSNYYNFRAEEFELTINYSRTITVNIVGEVITHGSFTFPAINTAFNALVASGGPSDIGSVRNIKLIRAGEPAKKIDVYEYLFNPSVKDNFYLQDNDFIYVPIAERLVSVSGAVKRPFKYELSEGEDLMKLIEFAGGFQNDAYKGNLQVKRIANDEVVIIDVDYQDLSSKNQDFKLLSGDEIVIRTIPKLYKNFVDIDGSVEYPGRFELTGGMKVIDLINKGILLDDARTDIAFVQRVNIAGKVKYERINIAAILANPQSSSNFTLQAQDRLIVYGRKLYTDNGDFAVDGTVRKPIRLPYSPGEEIRVKDAIELAGGLLPNSTTYGYIRRRDFNNSKNRRYVRVDLVEALQDSTSAANIKIEPFDELIVYSIERFTDVATVEIAGTVRAPQKIAYAENLRVRDLVTIAGGLKPDATLFGYISRSEVGNLKKRQYIRVDLVKALSDPNSPENILLEPFDVLKISYKGLYTDDAFVQVTGAVREPDKFPYADNFSVKDLLTMAGGLKLEASKSKIDIFRILIKDDQPTESIVATVKVDADLNVTSGGGDFQLMPFDIVVVRRVPEFEFQNVVTLEGEVKYPGPYTLMEDNERLRSVIQRAGGLNEEAFPAGAILYRNEDKIGFVVIELDDIMKRGNSRKNLILKKGDVITIPKQKDLVTIKGATKVVELYPDKILQEGKINVVYKKGKSAKWYVDHYAAGVGERGKKKLITVEYPNGEIKRTKNFLFFKIYPSVKEGSIVTVGTKPPKKDKKDGEGKGERTNWGKTLADSLAQATAILSLILLVQQVNK